MLPATLEDADPLLRARYEEQIEGSLDLYGDLVAAGIPGNPIMTPGGPILIPGTTPPIIK